MFDLGGVLVQSTGRIALRALLPELQDENLVLERWHGSQAVGLFERGRVSPQAFATAFVREWNLHLDESAFLESFGSWVQGFFEGAEQLIQKLRTQHRVACLSNTNAVHWARLAELPELFDFCFASHLSGFMKPNHEAYLHALRALNVLPTAVYFFDDLLPNVAAAREVGMNAFQVRGLMETEGTLRAVGLLSDEMAQPST